MHQILYFLAVDKTLNFTRAAKLNGEMICLWRGVYKEGEILESYVSKTSVGPKIIDRIHR